MAGPRHQRCVTSPKTAPKRTELKKQRRTNLSRLRQRFILTTKEKQVVVFVVAAFFLGLTVKHYRETHSSPPASIPQDDEPRQKFSAKKSPHKSAKPATAETESTSASTDDD
jgi:hypothetical protein